MSTLSIEGLSWAVEVRRGAPRWLLRGIGLQVNEGEFVGLIGPNGSGKTSLLRCAYRSTTPARGHLCLDGEDLWQRSARWSAQRIAVVLQEFPQEFGLTVKDVVAMGRAPHKGLFDADTSEDARHVAQALEHVGLSTYAGQAFATLSGGEKQRVLLARALVQQPGLLILDEPTNHLDPRYQLELLRHLRGLGLSILASFHDLNLAAAFCDRIYVIAEGEIVARGTPAEVLTAELIEQVFGVKALVDRHPLHAYPRVTWIT
ncbi:ABC transporter ATP-binding protein [Pseudomonas matsuisoli]|uniref:ABC transporter ATP-binding protein n=1 Tax=Pseudomonas matsuisoli TaxID=1515666 RepID=A0A917UV66_9PSED|nr:ABC transporter ATP-binding protein [Pseudomonas matsuisoli]GGJ87551.1 ABC transporter ATP-binding protein [Pseudomonas matsuisoli]